MSENEDKNLGGRPSKYQDKKSDKQVFKLCLLGATIKEIAAFFEVNEDTIYEWQKVHPTFSEAIKKGRVEADAEIGNSLYQRAKGFKKKAVKIFQHEGQSYEHHYMEYFPPDPTSMIYWLKNRRGRVDEAGGAQKWADKHEHVHDGAVPVKLVFGHDPKNEPINDSTGGGDTGKTDTGI